MGHEPTPGLRVRTFLVASAAALAACGGGERAADVSLPDGLTAEVVAEGLEGPTQLIDAPDGDGWWLAQLGGPEGSGRGEVVSIAPDGATEVLLEGLDKPTGIAVWRDALWVQSPTQLLRAPLDEGRPGEPEPVITGLPNNGRSQGTLSVFDDALLYTTTGALRGGEPVEGSGMLWRLTTPDADPEPIAAGLKNGYAHTAVGDRRVVTEVAEPLSGFGVPPEELNVLVEGGDYGWPDCVGDRQPVSESATCEGTEAPIATFPPGSTPTSVAVSPFGDEILVALWMAGEVVAVPAGGGEPEPWLTGIENPQHLLVSGEDLLVVDHTGGRLLRVRRAR